jgi:hypothetical protein
VHRRWPTPPLVSVTAPDEEITRDEVTTHVAKVKAYLQWAETLLWVEGTRANIAHHVVANQACPAELAMLQPQGLGYSFPDAEDLPPIGPQSLRPEVRLKVGKQWPLLTRPYAAIHLDRFRLLLDQLHRFHPTVLRTVIYQLNDPELSTTRFIVDTDAYLRTGGPRANEYLLLPLVQLEMIRKPVAMFHCQALRQVRLEGYPQGWHQSTIHW